MTGKDILVNLATNASGAATSTAAQVIAAINASPAASALVSATTFRNNAGAATVQPRPRSIKVDDFLNAPAHVARRPFQRAHVPHRLRPQRHQGRRVPLLPAARSRVDHRPVLRRDRRAARKNYATDPDTKKLMDQMEVFVVPNINPDGGHYSMYDFAGQRRNMTNHSPRPSGRYPAARNAWGVDLNRNNGEYSPFDGYFGASTSCTNDVYQGPGEYSEPEIPNEKWVVDTFPNIKFANNVHSFGGYFMWAPGSDIGAGRITAPRRTSASRSTSSRPARRSWPASRSTATR